MTPDEMKVVLDKTAESWNAFHTPPPMYTGPKNPLPLEPKAKQGYDAIPMPKAVAKLSYILCGCCCVEATWGAIYHELERLERSEFREDDDLACALVDHCGMSEHGTSIRGGWLTDAGKEALAFFREYGVNFRDTGFFVDPDNNCHVGEPIA